jgi:hypothetical protein
MENQNMRFCLGLDQKTAQTVKIFFLTALALFSISILRLALKL